MDLRTPPEEDLLLKLTMPGKSLRPGTVMKMQAALEKERSMKQQQTAPVPSNSGQQPILVIGSAAQHAMPAPQPVAQSVQPSVAVVQAQQASPSVPSFSVTREQSPLTAFIPAAATVAAEPVVEEGQSASTAHSESPVIVAEDAPIVTPAVAPAMEPAPAEAPVFMPSPQPSAQSVFVETQPIAQQHAVHSPAVAESGTVRSLHDGSAVYVSESQPVQQISDAPITSATVPNSDYQKQIEGLALRIMGSDRKKR